MNTRNKLASEIAKRESKKKSISIGNCREALRILVELEAEARMHGVEPTPLLVLARDAAALMSKRIAKLVTGKTKKLNAKKGKR